MIRTPPATLDDWAIRMGCLTGIVHGAVHLPDGKRICTSLVKSVDGRVVTTATGQRYELRQPSADHVAQLDVWGLPYNDADPMAAWRAFQPGGAHAV